MRLAKLQTAWTFFHQRVSDTTPKNSTSRWTYFEMSWGMWQALSSKEYFGSTLAFGNSLEELMHVTGTRVLNLWYLQHPRRMCEMQVLHLMRRWLTMEISITRIASRRCRCITYFTVETRRIRANKAVTTVPADSQDYIRLGRFQAQVYWIGVRYYRYTIISVMAQLGIGKLRTDWIYTTLFWIYFVVLPDLQKASELLMR